MTDSASAEKEVAAVGGRSRWTRCAVLGAVCALVIGVYAWSANSGLLELLSSGAQDSYYNLLVQGFRDGHLNVKHEVSPELAQHGHEDGWLDNHGLHDLSLYKGKLYLYFGVTPAVALFWPYVALTGHYLPHKDAVMIFFSVGFLAGAALLWAVWRRYFPEAGVWVVAAGTLALGLANLAPAILARCDVYEVAISCGYALTMLALGGIWFALQEGERSWRWLAGASLAYGLAVGARPSLLFGGIILLVPVVQGWRAKRRMWPLLLSAAVPMVLVGLGLMLYNAMRFGNPLEFGQRYQLPMNPHEEFRLRYFWFNFQVGFLDPAQWGGHFPFVHDIAAPAQPRAYAQVDHAFGVLTNIPVVWLALAMPLAWRSQPVETRSVLRWFLGAVALFFGMCALPIGLHDSICMRYEIEFASPLVLLAVIGVLAVEHRLAGRPVWRLAARCGWGLLLAFSVAFNLLASFEMKANNLTSFGNALVQAGRVDEAITQYQEALHIRPDDMEAYINLGSALLQQGRVDEANAHFQKALQIKPDDMETHSTLGSVLMQKGRVDDAITQYQKALQIKPDDAEARNDLGDALLQRGRLDEAIAQYQKAVQIQPDYAEAHNDLGSALLQKGRVDDAITQYQKALQLNPDLALAHYNLGDAFLQKARLDDAITQYQEAVRLKPDLALAHSNLGLALAQKGRMDEAISQFQKALENNPGDADAHYNLAIALLQKGGVDEAIAHLQKALELKPDTAAARQNLGNALLRKGKTDEAIAQFQAALQLKPDYADAHNNLGYALLRNGRVDEAIAHFQKVLEIKPDDVEAHFNLGNALVQKGRVDEAIPHFQKALEIKPDDAEARQNLSNALVQAGRVGEAIAQYQKGLEIKPADPAFQNNLAWLLATCPEPSLRNGGKAVELARQANLLTGGENPIILHTLAAAYAEVGRFPEAVETAQHALRLAEAQSNSGLAGALQSELKLYQADRPWHGPEQTP